MASPTLETFCCAFNGTKPVRDLLADYAVSYNLVCIGTSFMGIFGAVIQLSSSNSGLGLTDFLSPSLDSSSLTGPRANGRRQSRIICWLAGADFLAAIGVLLRSSIWLWDGLKGLPPVDALASLQSGILCATMSSWIHFFYTASYFWTFLYALDVYRTVQELPPLSWTNHMVAWALGGALTALGAGLLYAPDLSCHHGESLGYLYILPNYLASLLPMVTTMIANPILYAFSFKNIEFHLAVTRGEFSSEEHAAVDLLKIKFYAINFVFYLCWFPNILNFLVIWISWPMVPETLFFVLWYLMAVLNPLQALLNCLVYGQWRGWFLSFWLREASRSGERTPLLYHPSPSGITDEPYPSQNSRRA